MPDERDQSIREGIAPPEECDIGREADLKHREESKKIPPSAWPDSAMGGASDGNSPGDEAPT